MKEFTKIQCSLLPFWSSETFYRILFCIFFIFERSQADCFSLLPFVFDSKKALENSSAFSFFLNHI